MKALLIAFGILAPSIASATSIADYQSDCEKQFDKFTEMASCLSKKVKSDDLTYSSPQAKIYVATANSLAGRVRRGEMHDEDAALALQEKYATLNNEYLSANARKSPDIASSIREKIQQGQRTQQQQQTIIIAPEQKKNCYTPNGPINYSCIYGQ
ncbi:hypothetical protein [Serratia sp. 14-2641]|uniref:hypothetical protein n=1 Tax=Serratia sp. 14-2641 TaxID=1841657 RepID=UPI00080FA12C|nr:hypothetical protein [Serratia sp. 14-2641]OCJ30577.1 hypothetical protein A6U95_06660 [Serratia sp. 14-2641]